MITIKKAPGHDDRGRVKSEPDECPHLPGPQPYAVGLECEAKSARSQWL